MQTSTRVMRANFNATIDSDVVTTDDIVIKKIWRLYSQLLQHYCFRSKGQKVWHFPVKLSLIGCLRKIEHICRCNKIDYREYMLAQFYSYNRNKRFKRPQLFWFTSLDCIDVWEEYKNEVLVHVTVDNILRTIFQNK